MEEYVRMYDRENMPLPGSHNEGLDMFSPFIRRMRATLDNPWRFGAAQGDEVLWKKYIQYYYALVTEVDYHIGRIIGALEKEGLLENTVIIYTSDHGEFLGAHGLAEKMTWGHNVYEDTLRVPLIVSWKDHIRENISSDELVELVDIYPMLMELCGTAGVGGSDLDGLSLKGNLMTGEALGRKFAVSENLIQLTAIGKRYKLGTWLKPEDTLVPDVLFDLESDPLELVNLAGTRQGVEDEMREFLTEWIKKTPAEEYGYNSQGSRMRAPGYYRS